MEDFDSIVLPSHGNPIVLDWIRDGKAVFQPGPLETPCLVWQKAKTGQGYGAVVINRRTLGAHRISINAQNGFFTLHSCNNQACVNPNHLRQGTQRENMIDKEKCGNGLRESKYKRCACGVAMSPKSKHCYKCLGEISVKPLCECGINRVLCKGLCNCCYRRQFKLIKKQGGSN